MKKNAKDMLLKRRKSMVLKEARLNRISANLWARSLRLLPRTQTTRPRHLCSRSTASQATSVPSSVHAVRYGRFNPPGTVPRWNLRQHFSVTCFVFFFII